MLNNITELSLVPFTLALAVYLCFIKNFHIVHCLVDRYELLRGKEFGLPIQLLQGFFSSYSNNSTQRPFMHLFIWSILEHN